MGQKSPWIYVVFFLEVVTMFAILFDLDGTLVDSDPVHFEAWQTILAQMKPDQPLIDREFFDKHISGRLTSFSQFHWSPNQVLRSTKCQYYSRSIGTSIDWWTRKNSREKRITFSSISHRKTPCNQRSRSNFGVYSRESI